ncbi:MAG: helix-hairpin-helix domain-containing protein [Candidatus Rokubacteria bacterium]|nr:helix-hairpin-helix domain-containing protein [Candidatus Rokubacteria bacterium]
MEIARVSIVVLLGLLVVAPAAVGAGPAPSAEARVAAATAPVNINTAGVKELMTLAGVGRKVAEKIVEYRTTKGPFKKPEDLRRVEGIGGGLWEKNRERIVVK